MRLILIYRFGVFQNKTERVYIEILKNTTDLLTFVENKVKKPSTEFVVRVKKDFNMLRVVPGWSIDHYGVQEGCEIEIELPDKEDEEIENNIKNRYLLNLLGNNNKKTLAQIAQTQETDQNEHNELQSTNATNIVKKFQMRTYLDHQLERMLKQVQKGTLEGLISILQTVTDVPQELIPDAEAKKMQLLNQLGEGGWAIIHYAVYCDRIDIIEWMLRNNANINKTTNEGWTPLMIAINRKNYTMIKFLINLRSCNINQVTSKGSALHVAARIGDINSVNILLQSDIDIRLLDQKNKTCLDVTIFEDCKNIILDFQEKKNRKKQQEKQSFLPSVAIYRGTVYKVRSLFLNLSERFMVLDPYSGTLIRYQNQACYPKKPKDVIPILNIKAIRMVKQQEKSWPMTKQYSYFQIYTPSRMIMACRFSKIAEKWVRGIYNSKIFVSDLQKNKRDSTNTNTIERFIITLDDTTGRILDSRKQIKEIPVKLPERIKTVTLLQADKRRPNTQSEDQFSRTNRPLTATTIANRQEKLNIQETDCIKVKTKEEIEQKNRQGQENLTLSLKELVKDDKTNFSSFEILNTLGSGSFGKVFLVRHIQNKKLYALKALKKKTLLTKKQLKYAIAEATNLKKTNHPFIINLYYAFQTPNYLYLALDYCPGKDLSFHLAKQITLKQEQARFYICQLLLAIEHLHEKNIIYRDMKPQNILLDAEGHVKLADFGLSKDNSEDNKIKSFCGSPAYLSPQMLNKNGVGKQADLYGLGCVMYEFLVGQPPYYSEDVNQLYRNIKQAKLKFPKGITDNAKSLIIGLLERDPRRRLGSKDKNEIKNHPFFKGINWEEVLQRKLQPPKRAATAEQEQIQDQEVQLIQKIKQVNFTDNDYEDSDARINRLANFSFAKEH